MNNKITNSTIFITGGAGFIGSYVIEELLLNYQPKKIIILDNLIRGSFENMMSFIDNPIIDFREGDIRNSDILEKCIEGSDYVFHMAALRINACAANQQEGFEVMIQATFNIANLCLKHKVKKLFIHPQLLFMVWLSISQLQKQIIHITIKPFMVELKCGANNYSVLINLCII